MTSSSPITGLSSHLASAACADEGGPSVTSSSPAAGLSSRLRSATYSGVPKEVPNRLSSVTNSGEGDATEGLNADGMGPSGRSHRARFTSFVEEIPIVRTYTSRVSKSLVKSMSLFCDFGELRMQAALSQGGVELDNSMALDPVIQRAYSIDRDYPMISASSRVLSRTEGDYPMISASSRVLSRLVDINGDADEADKESIDVNDRFLIEQPRVQNASITWGRWQHSSPCEDSKLLVEQTPVQRASITREVVGLSKNQVVVYLVTAILGCGVVVLPSLMKLGGWFVVPILTGLTSLAFVEVARMMDLAITKAEKSMCITSFEDLGRAAMKDTGVGLIRSVTGTGFFGTLIVYTILIGHNVSGLLHDLVSVKVGILCVSPVLLVLAILKDSTLASIMGFGMFASLTSCVLICIKGYLDAHVWMGWPAQELARMHNTWPEEPASVGTVLAVLFAAFSVMGTVPCIRGQMRDRQQFLPAFRLAISLVFCVYLAVMLLGYWGYGNYVQHNVVDSMMFPPMTPEEARKAEQGELPHGSQGGRPVGIIMAVLVTLYLFLSFSLFFKCTAGMIQNLANGMCKLDKTGIAQYAIRVALVVVVVLVATAVPHFRDLMGIMSSVCCSCNNVFFPLLFAFKLEDNEFQVSVLRRLAHTCICCLGLFCFCLGLYNSLSSLIKEMSS